MYTIDRTFAKDLKRLDRRLGWKFNGENFVITYDRGYGKPVNLFTIRDERGGFRQPNRHDLEYLRASDLERERPQDRLNRMAKMALDIREQDRIRAKQNLRDMTKDGKIQLKNAFTQIIGAGKGNSAFRRISP